MSRPPYPSDVSDEEWLIVAPYLTLMEETAPHRAVQEEPPLPRRVRHRDEVRLPIEREPYMADQPFGENRVDDAGLAGAALAKSLESAALGGWLHPPDDKTCASGGHSPSRNASTAGKNASGRSMNGK